MNYFGLFFSFMVPGIIIGVMAAAAVREQAKASRRKAPHSSKTVKSINKPAVSRDRLYVYDMSEAA